MRKEELYHLSINYYPPLRRALVYVIRCGKNMHTYIRDDSEDRSISMASVKRAMRYQAALIGKE